MKKNKFYIVFLCLLLSMVFLFAIPVSVSADVMYGDLNSMAISYNDWLSRVLVPKYDSAGNFTSYSDYVQDSSSLSYFNTGDYLGYVYCINRYWTGFKTPTSGTEEKYYPDLRYQFSCPLTEMFSSSTSPILGISVNQFVCIELSNSDGSGYIIDNTSNYPFLYQIAVTDSPYGEGTIYYQSAWTDLTWIASKDRTSFSSYWQLTSTFDIEFSGNVEALYYTVTIRGIQETYEGNSTEYLLTPKNYRFYFGNLSGNIIYGYKDGVTANPWNDFTKPDITESPYPEELESVWAELTLPDLAHTAISFSQFFINLMQGIWDMSIVRYVAVPIMTTGITYYICRMVLFRS